eukprot:153724-Pyramimonas_sp.AAC.1
MYSDEVDPFDDIIEYGEDGSCGGVDPCEELVRYEQDMDKEFQAAYGDVNGGMGSPMHEHGILYASEKAHESDGHPRSHVANGQNPLGRASNRASKSPKDRAVGATPKIDTTAMNEVWKAASIIHARDEADEPPSLIAASAAYKSDPEGARALAR